MKKASSFICLLFVLFGTAGIFLLCAVNLRLGCRLTGVPTLLCHLCIDFILHAKTVVKGLLEGGIHIGGGRFNCSVHKDVASIFHACEDIIHYNLVLQSHTPLQ